MNVSVFDMFKVGIGPSSSHTVGPMRAARRFLADLQDDGRLDEVAMVTVELYGSLALTGKGHGTDRAILLGLSGEAPDSIDADTIPRLVDEIRSSGRLRLLGEREIAFHEPSNLVFHNDEVLPEHSNGMRFTAIDGRGETLRSDEYYSIGGGFIIRAGERREAGTDAGAVPYPFGSAAELLDQCARAGLTIAELMLENEKVARTEAQIRQGIQKIWAVMQDCVARGLREQGILPGGLKVRRRAAKLFADVQRQDKAGPLDVLDWVNLFALAVNEENAAGGRVVTAPTNGAAGVIPAVHVRSRRPRNAAQSGRSSPVYGSRTAEMPSMVRPGFRVGNVMAECRRRISIFDHFMTTGGTALPVRGRLDARRSEAPLFDQVRPHATHHLALAGHPGETFPGRQGQRGQCRVDCRAVTGQPAQIDLRPAGHRLLFGNVIDGHARDEGKPGRGFLQPTGDGRNRRLVTNEQVPGEALVDDGGSARPGDPKGTPHFCPRGPSGGRSGAMHADVERERRSLGVEAPGREIAARRGCGGDHQRSGEQHVGHRSGSPFHVRAGRAGCATTRPCWTSARVRGVSSSEPWATTSSTETTRRRVPLTLATCTTRSRAERTCSRTAANGMAPRSATTIVSIRRRASGGLLA